MLMPMITCKAAIKPCGTCLDLNLMFLYVSCLIAASNLLIFFTVKIYLLSLSLFVPQDQESASGFPTDTIW